MRQVQLSSFYIRSGQPGHHPERHQVVPRLTDPLLRRTQPGHQEGSFLLERQGQPEGEGERDHLPAHLLIGGERFYLLGQETQALFVATREVGSDLDQGPQQAQTPLDQRHLGLGEQKRWLPVQDLLHARDGPLHLGGHTGMQRFGADTDGVEEAKSGIKGEACMRTQDRIWQGEHPGVDGSC